MTFTIATRASRLALTQSGWVGRHLSALAGEPFELVHITTEGDVRRDPLASLGGQGVFIAAVRRAVLEGRCDLAVHSMKDLPSADAPGLVFGAIPEREDPVDVLCARDSHTLATLPVGARVGTGSPRRAAQLRLARPDLEIVDIRGNVGTRLARIDADLDAVVLARAGLARLGLLDAVTDTLPLISAAGQGALAIECRPETLADDTGLARALALFDHGPTRLEAAAERALLAGLGAGCTTPVGARARARDGRVEIETVLVVAGVATRDRIEGEAATCEQARQLGLDLARRLRGGVPSLAMLRPEGGALAADLAAAGVGLVTCPVVRDEPLPVAPDELAEALEWVGDGWLTVTSARTVAHLARLADGDAALAARLRGVRVACVGAATARAARQAGLRVEVVGETDAASLAGLIPAGTPGHEGAIGDTRVVMPGSALAKSTLAGGVAARGFVPRALPLYTMVVSQPGPGELDRAASCDAVVATSSSQVEAWFELGGRPDVKWIAFGTQTAAALAAHGLTAVVAPSPDAAGVLAALGASGVLTPSDADPSKDR